MISSEIIVNSNIVDEKICNFIDIGISYDSDIDKAMEIMRDEALAHPNCIDNRTEEEIEEGVPQVATRVIGFGDSSVNLRAFIWTRDHSDGYIMKTELYKRIKEQFDKNGIEIPFPYRTIVYKKDI